MTGSKPFGPLKDFPPLTEPSSKPMLRKLSEEQQSGSLNPLSFLELSDTPGSYSGKEYYVPVVNPSESGLIFLSFNHSLLLNSHNLTSDIDHNLIANYVAAEHIRWDIPGAELIDTSRLDLTAINASDDDFHSLSSVAVIDDEDELLIADYSDSWQYKKVTKADLLSGYSTILNSFGAIYPESGVSLTAVDNDYFHLIGDGDLIQTRGEFVAENKIYLDLISKPANYVFAGPSTGVDDTPSFRTLVDDDMPTSYDPINWNTAYTHANVTGNPHGTTLDDIGAVFSADIPVVLTNGKNFGKYLNGETIPATGKTFEQIIIDLATEYISASFTSFSVSGQATTVEVGTTLSGSRTFTWSINEGSGSVNLVDIYDITDSSYLVTDTANDGTEALTITTIQLNSNAASQQWRAIATDEGPDPDVNFNSNIFTVTARFYRFYGPSSSTPSNDTEVRALPSNDWQTGTDTWILNTGSTLSKFIVCLPPGVTISSVTDLDALNADITSEYVLQGTVTVVDAGGTNRNYNLYEMNIAIPYSSSHRHQITAG